MWSQWRPRVRFIAGVLILFAALFLGVSFSLRSNDIILHDIETLPGEKSLSTASNASVWSPTYDLTLTGLTFTPNVFASHAQRVALADTSSQTLVIIDLQRKNFVQLPTIPDHIFTALTFTDTDELVAFAKGLWRYDADEQTWHALTPELILPAPVTHLATFAGH